MTHINPRTAADQYSPTFDVDGDVTIQDLSEVEKNKKLLDLFKSIVDTFGNNWNTNLNVVLKRQTLSRILYYAKLYEKIITVPGVICEFGCLYGATLSLLQNLRGIYEPYNYTRTIVGFDTFSGLSSIDPKDGAAVKEGDFSTVKNYPKILEAILALHESFSPLDHIKKSEVVVGDVSKTLPIWLEQNQHAVVSMAIFDMDIYKPTKDALKLILPRLTKGSVLVFDELSTKRFPGESLAVNEVLGFNNLRLHRDPHAPTCAWAVFGE